MGIFSVAPKGGNRVSVESPQQKISHEMSSKGHILALFSKEGRFLTDHMGKGVEASGSEQIADGFYLAMNLNFVLNFGNSLKMGLYDPSGVTLVSTQLASLKMLHQFGDDAVVHTNSKTSGNKVGVADYDEGILITLLKLPKGWGLPEEGQLKVKLQSTMIFNPLEMETFLLRVRM